MKLTDKVFKVLYRRRLRKRYELPKMDEFSATIRKISAWCDFAARDLGPASRIEMLDFIIDAVKVDLQSSVGTELIYAGTRSPRPRCDALFPFSDEYCAEEAEISSAGLTVVSYPWDRYRLSRAVHDILRNGFRSDLGERTGAYYPELKLIVVENGLHHSFVATQMRQDGIYKVDVYPLQNIFPHVSTDGKHWYDNKDPAHLSDVLDIRMAILYELARIKYQLLPEQPD